MNEIKTITLKEKEIKRIEYGHWWIFSNELEKVDTTVPKGEICRFEYRGGRPCGIGFFNPHSLIAGRLLVKNSYSLEDDFVKNRLERAFSFRKQLGLEDSARVFFGESDFLGGLIIDKYENSLVIELLSAGADALKNDIAAAAQKVFSPDCTLIKRNHQYRTLEGIEIKEDEILGRPPKKTIIKENGLKFSVDIFSGQKTGWYFDQRENREFLAPYFKDRKVLDLYCYTGAFSLTAAKNGAHTVWGIDSSAKAVEKAAENAALNKIPETKILFKEGDSEKALEALEHGELPEKPDFILIDPPNYVRSKKHIEQAKKLYLKILSKAIKGVGPNGYVAFSTCSHHISQELFKELLNRAAGIAGRRTFLLELRMQAKDHPIIVGMEETKYLNFAFLRVM